MMPAFRGMVMVLLVHCTYSTHGKGLYLSPPHPRDYREDFEEQNDLLRRLTDQTNNRIESLQGELEPTMDNMGAKLNSLDKKLTHLEHKIHPLGDFQTSLTAWNSQLASLERKMDVFNSLQDKLTYMQDKIDSLSNFEDIINQILVKVKFLELKVTSKLGSQNGHGAASDDATRNVMLNTLKAIEKNTDKLLLMKSTASPALEEILNDVSSKVTVLVTKSDKQQTTEESSLEYDLDDSTIVPGNGTDVNGRSFGEILKNTYKHCINNNKFIDEVVGKATAIENISKLLLEKENAAEEKQLNNDFIIIDKLHGALDRNSRETRDLIHEQSDSLQRFLQTEFSKMNATVNRNLEIAHSGVNENPPALADVQIQERVPISPVTIPNKSSCEELDSIFSSGVYVFDDNTEDPSAIGDIKRRLRQRYCEMRDDGSWTVIQRRDNFQPLQSFSLPWARYKTGFGDLTGDFWYGNDLIHRLTAEKEMVLRVELEDFEGRTAWAQYSAFRVMSEGERYRLMVGGYTGNASDALAYHNNSHFSTYDRKNDEAPACCPCAVSYDGGWWFKSCFKCNLNGQYRKEPDVTFIPYRGIQWQGEKEADHPFKKSVMMLKSKDSFDSSIEVEPTEFEYTETTTLNGYFVEEP